MGDHLSVLLVRVPAQASGCPAKDVLYDNLINGVSFSITVSDTLTAIANGRLKKNQPANRVRLLIHGR